MKPVNHEAKIEGDGYYAYHACHKTPKHDASDPTNMSKVGLRRLSDIRPTQRFSLTSRGLSERRLISMAIPVVFFTRSRRDMTTPV